MNLTIVSCKIFKDELEKILPALQKEISICKIDIQYLPAALHIDERKIEAGIKGAFGNLQGQNKVLLYGCMCHTNMGSVAGENLFLPMGNCIDSFITPKQKQEFENGLNIHYLTSGWVRFWKDIFAGKIDGWDPVTARMNLGVNDKALILDTGCLTITETDMFELFEYTGLSVEIASITLDYFTGNVIDLCKRFLNQL
ncbi:hypothetical protein FACS1894190_04900 [Spirochaetia bacterium]|nr:hypothetical protein FACS1894190_04900 [Spirochaetia bacterium]